MPLQAPRRHLQRTTIAVLVATFCALGLGQYAATRWWYDRTAAAAERQDGLDRARLAERTILTQRDMLRRIARDEGRWDETYRFVVGRNPGYFQANWEPDTFANLSIDVAAFVATDGRVVALRAADDFTRRYVEPGPGFEAVLAPGAPLLAHLGAASSDGGVVRVGRDLYVYGAAPVLPTSGQPPAAGAIVLFHALGPVFVGRLADAVDAHVTLAAVPVADAPPAAAAPLFDGRDDRVLAMRFSVCPTLDGEALVARILSARPVHAAAAAAARAVLWSAIGAGVLVVLFAVVFFERRLLRPLRLISLRLVEIGRAGDPSARLKLHDRDDEIGTVAHAANLMLTELEETKRAADAARDDALAASRVKSEFLARMSHEIRTPMNGVLGMTELLERTELSARQRKFCDTIHRSAVSLLDIINDILDFSKIEAQRLELEPTDCDVATVVEDTAELLCGRAHGRDLELVVDVRQGVPASAHLDAVRLRQVLTNLIGNALKFTEQGEVVVTVDAATGPDARTTLEFVVADSGVGIEPAALQHLFEPFAQADASTTRRFGGTGLGLAIARQLVELMGGTMHVESQPGRGSVFSFRIPVVATAARATAGVRARLLEGVRVLLADPSATCRAVLERQLAAAGAVVASAADEGELAAALADGRPRPAALLVDHRLATTLGVRATLGVPIITMAPPADAGVEAGSDSGVVGYLTKPVRRALLLATLARVAGRDHALDTATFLASVGLGAGGERLGARVLVVEDNPVKQAVAAGMLETLGCEVRLAADGVEALERLAEERPDVVLMDCQMPFMDGIEATRRLREREAAAHALRVPVIGISAHAMQGAREECLLAGMNDFLAKPFTMAGLARVLRRHVRRAAPAAEPRLAQARAASGTNGRGSGPV